MARVTVEDCVDKVTNRFELVLLATHRARLIGKGSQVTIDREDDKDGVIALREIAPVSEEEVAAARRRLEARLRVLTSDGKGDEGNG